MKILIVSSVMKPMTNGVATFVNNLCYGLAEDGNEVALICSSFTGKPHRKKVSFKGKNGGMKSFQIFFVKSKRFAFYPDQMHDFKSKKPPYKYGIWLSFHPRKEISKILDEFQPDVIHLETPEFLSLAAMKEAKKRQIPIVYTNHSYPEAVTGWMKASPWFKKLFEKFVWKFFRNFALKSSFITTPTKRVMQDLVKTPGRTIEVPIAVISNGLNLEDFKNLAKKDKTRKKYGIPIEKKVVIYVGRVDAEKNIEKVLLAFNALHEEKPQTMLVIVGEGNDFGRLKKMTKRMELEKDVKFLGKILMPELANVYVSGDIFASASEMETEGIVFIEATAAGLPLVGVDKGGVSEICITGKSGILCSPGNDEVQIIEFKEAMKSLLFDEKIRKKTSSGALEVAKEHDFNLSLKRFENIYSYLCKK